MLMLFFSTMGSAFPCFLSSSFVFDGASGGAGARSATERKDRVVEKGSVSGREEAALALALGAYSVVPESLA